MERDDPRSRRDGNGVRIAKPSVRKYSAVGVRGAVLALVLLAGTSAPFLPSRTLGQPPVTVGLPEVARPIQGSLVICGGATLPNQVIQRFVELAGGPEARLVVIPTATAAAENPGELERRIAIWRAQPVKDLKILHTRSRETADDPDFASPLARATGVWFMGGAQARITDTYLGTRTEDELHEVLRRGGVIGGTSAGAAIMTEVMIRSSRAGKVDVGEGFGFLPNAVVDQHFLRRNREPRLMSVLADRPGYFGLGIDEETAVVIQDRMLSVVGNSNAVVCLPQTDGLAPETGLLKPGDEADFVRISGRALARVGGLSNVDPDAPSDADSEDSIYESSRDAVPEIVESEPKDRSAVPNQTVAQRMP